MTRPPCFCYFHIPLRKRRREIGTQGFDFRLLFRGWGENSSVIPACSCHSRFKLSLKDISSVVKFNLILNFSPNIWVFDQSILCKFVACGVLNDKKQCTLSFRNFDSCLSTDGRCFFVGKVYILHRNEFLALELSAIIREVSCRPFGKFDLYWRLFSALAENGSGD